MGLHRRRVGGAVGAVYGRVVGYHGCRNGIFYHDCRAESGVVPIRAAPAAGASAAAGSGDFEVLLVRRQEVNTWFSRKVQGEIKRINGRELVFFTEDDSLPLLNEMALYVLQNEQNKRLRVVHCYTDTGAIPPELGANIGTIDHIYPELRIDLLLVQGEFGPTLIERLSRRLSIPKNYMFIDTPSDRFPHSLDSLGGVRLIM